MIEIGKIGYICLLENVNGNFEVVHSYKGKICFIGKDWFEVTNMDVIHMCNFPFNSAIYKGRFYGFTKEKDVFFTFDDYENHWTRTRIGIPWYI